MSLGASRKAHPGPALPWALATPVFNKGATSKVPPGYYIQPSWFSDRIIDFDLWLVCEGSASLTLRNGEQLLLTRGSTVWIGPGDVHDLRVEGKSPYTNVYLHFDFFDEKFRKILPSRIIRPHVAGFTHDVLYFEATLRHIMYLEFQQRDAQGRARESLLNQSCRLLEGLLHEHELSRLTSGAPIPPGLDKHHAQVIAAAVSWLHLYPEAVSTGEEIARKFGYSQRHFGRLFLSLTGKTPRQVLIEARIDRAKKLLATSALNVGEIASSLRYDSLFYFSRQFKSLTGMAPRDFRRSQLLNSRKSNN